MRYSGLSDAQWAAVEPHLPKNQPGARRVDDRRVISGIFHVLKIGCRWQDCPVEYGPSTTIYNRFNRWSYKRFWLKLLEDLAAIGAVTKSTAVDSTYVKAQRSAFGGKGGARAQAIGPSRGGQTTKIHVLTDVVGRPFALTLTPGNVSDITVAPGLLTRASGARYVLADKGYDADALRQSLRQAGAVPVIPGRITRKKKVVYDRRALPGSPTLSRTPYAGSRISAASPPATTSSPPTSYPPSPSPPCSPSGSEGWTLMLGGCRRDVADAPQPSSPRPRRRPPETEIRPDDWAEAQECVGPRLSSLDRPPSFGRHSELAWLAAPLGRYASGQRDRLSEARGRSSSSSRR